MRALIVLSLFTALCATKNVPLTQINDYIVEHKQLMNQIKDNVTAIGEFIKKINYDFHNFIQSPNLTGAIESKEKSLLEIYNINQESIKECIEKKNSEIEAVSLKIEHNKDTCKWMSKAVTKQLMSDFSEMSELGTFVINTISLETETCLKNYENDEKNCLKCLSEKRKPITDQVNIFINKLAKLIDDTVPGLEESIGIVSICVSQTKLYIKKSEKYIAQYLEECFLESNKL